MRTAKPTSRRRVGLALLVLLVCGVHVAVVTGFADRLRAFAPDSSRLQRMEVAFVRELRPTEVPVPAAAPRPMATPLPAARAASAPDRDAPPRPRPRRPQPVPPEPPLAAVEAPRQSPLEARAIDEGEPMPPTAHGVQDELASPKLATAHGFPDAVTSRDAATDATAAAASSPSSSPTSAASTLAANSALAMATAAAGTNFGWPASTQLRYLLKGNYRGEVEGSATVQWVRKGQRYQVQLEVAIGPSFAPLMSRSMVSQGELSDAGLVPRRYEERTRIGFSVRELALSFDATRAVLANGTSIAARAGMQDASSQFVQMSYLFTIDPTLLAAGRTVSFPVALPRRLDTWIYDVVGEEMLNTPIGELRTFHLRPRRESPRPGELVAQAWFAPSLQNLPVRILIHQDADSFIDMQIDGVPMQAEPENR